MHPQVGSIKAVAAMVGEGGGLSDRFTGQGGHIKKGGPGPPFPFAGVISPRAS